MTGWLTRRRVTAAIAVILILVSLVLAFQNERMMIAEQSRQARVQAETLAAGVASALAFDDIETAQEYLAAFERNPDIRGAEIRNAAGKRIAGFGSLLAPAQGPVTGGLVQVQGNEVLAASPVRQGPLVLGEVYLRKAIEPVGARASRYAPIGIVVLLAALLIAVLGKANAEAASAYAALQEEIRAREQAERALRQAQKLEALGQLTGGVAHDFSNVLMAALSGLELIDRAKTDERRQTLLAAIRDTLNRGAALTQQLLIFARRKPVRLEVVDTPRHLRKLAEMLRHSLGSQIALSLELDDDLWPVEVDVSQFDVALLNLAVNARDAMPEGGLVRLSARNRAALLDGRDAVQIDLQDQGCGMSPEQIERAFEPFYTTKDVGRGTGLGLSQVYGFVNSLGGEVLLKSSIGRGTRVTLSVPRATVQEAAVAPPGEAGVTS